jgi:hypothetical protein
MGIVSGLRKFWEHGQKELPVGYLKQVIVISRPTDPPNQAITKEYQMRMSSEAQDRPTGAQPVLHSQMLPDPTDPSRTQ